MVNTSHRSAVATSPKGPVARILSKLGGRAPRPVSAAYSLGLIEDQSRIRRLRHWVGA